MADPSFTVEEFASTIFSPNQDFNKMSHKSFQRCEAMMLELAQGEYPRFWCEFASQHIDRFMAFMNIVMTPGQPLNALTAGLPLIGTTPYFLAWVRESDPDVIASLLSLIVRFIDGLQPKIVTTGTEMSRISVPSPSISHSHPDSKLLLLQPLPPAVFQAIVDLILFSLLLTFLTCNLPPSLDTSFTDSFIPDPSRSSVQATFEAITLLLEGAKTSGSPARRAQVQSFGNIGYGFKIGCLFLQERKGKDIREFILDQGVLELHWHECEGTIRIGGRTSCEEYGGASRVKGDAMMACGKCRVVRYCSREHQRQDWKRHKKTCFARLW